MIKRIAALVGLLAFSLALDSTLDCARANEKRHVHDATARETLTVVEMDHGDELRFTLLNGQQRTFVLEKTSARIVEQPRGGIIYAFDCHFRADGQPLVLRRYVCSQETFYEPWVINGVRLWLSSSHSVFSLVPIRYPEDHHPLDADAIVVLQDATLPICPEPMHPWFPLEHHFINIGDCYNGDDPWLGPYLGEACHVGLDINMPTGTPLFTPIRFDDHWIFSADHRWRGVRRWHNGDIWGLQSHHVDKLLLDEHTPIEAQFHYAEAAGKGIGSHPHSHFEFRVGREVMNRGSVGGVEIDPWILFWQIFETDKAAKGHLGVKIDPLAPGQVGQPVHFSAKPTGGEKQTQQRFLWTFGDGGSSRVQAPEHTFSRAGVYPVTLVLDDGQQRVTHTQHITISGEAINRPALTLRATDDVSFRPRPAPAADVYGWAVPFLPHTLGWTLAPELESAQTARPVESDDTMRRTVELINIGAGKLQAAESALVEYLDGAGRDWLHVEHVGEGNQQRILVTPHAAGLPEGRHEALVTVHCPGAANPRQSFGVEMTIRPMPPIREVIVDDRDNGFYATPYFWVGHQFLRCPRRGFGKRYLTNGGLAAADEFVRFTPDLAEGRYEVLLHGDTPLSPESNIPVRVRHAAGESTLVFAPSEDGPRSLGVYDFHGGIEGFVELHAAGSRGTVVADALIFRPVGGK